MTGVPHPAARATRRWAGGLDTLAAALGEDPVTLETVVEPFRCSKVCWSDPTGRMVTDAARSHLRRPHDPNHRAAAAGFCWCCLSPAALDLQGLYEQALTASRRGDFAEALLWDQVLLQSPDDAAALSNAATFACLGDPDGAIADQSRSIHLAPEESDPHLNRAPRKRPFRLVCRCRRLPLDSQA